MDEKDPRQQWSWKITKHHGLWKQSRPSRKKLLRERRRERRRQRAKAMWHVRREIAKGVIHFERDAFVPAERE